MVKTEIKLNIEKIVNDFLRNLVVENKEEIIAKISETYDGTVRDKDQVKALKDHIQDNLNVVHKTSGWCFYRKNLAYLEFDDTSFKHRLKRHTAK